MEEVSKKRGTSQCYFDHKGTHFHSKVIKNISYHMIQKSDRSVNSDFSADPTSGIVKKAEEKYDYGHKKSKWIYKPKNSVKNLLEETSKHKVS